MWSINKNEYVKMFEEDFKISRENIPGNWIIERNSDLPHPGIALEGNSFNIFAPGNKFLPLVPELRDCRVELVFEFDNKLSKKCEIQLLFRYDRLRCTGQGGRFKLTEDELLLEYGTVKDNVFNSVQSTSIQFNPACFDREKTLIFDIQDDKMSLELLNVGKAEFSGLPAIVGAVVLCRGEFDGYMSVNKFKILSPDKFVPTQEREFEVTLPEAINGNYYPIRCAVRVKEFDQLIDMELEFRGSLQNEPLGEGNYHSMRVDKVTKPFFKVIATNAINKYTLADSTLMLTNHDLVPDYYYHVIYDDPEWPMRRRIRFFRPKVNFVFALGYEFFYHKQAAHLAGGPSETLFDLSGKTLYSGRSLTDLPLVVEFKSNPEKAIINDLPKTDPRYEQAVDFARNNHYFKEHEDICFNIMISSTKQLPKALTVTLENAFFEPFKTLDAQNISSNDYSIGALTCKQNIYRYTFGKQKPGVYHIRCRSAEYEVDNLNEYCAFEIMPEDTSSKPPPLLSGLPFLYSSMTETRGLETDHFDPWRGSSVDAGHYISCATFHPGFAKRNKIWDLVHLYGREWFVWLNNRTTDDFAIETNIDIIKNCDYIKHIPPGVSNVLHWRGVYRGKLLECLIRFLEIVENNTCEHLTLEKVKETKECLSGEAYYELTHNYWDQWLDFAGEWYNNECLSAANKELENINPNIKRVDYGPAHIYAAHYKGMNFMRHLGINKDSAKYYKGFFQFEDYPMLSRYGLARGVFFLTACKQLLPETRIYPEYYTISDQGCPDGALAYAYPPFGLCKDNPAIRAKRRIFEYAFATGWHDENGFHFWRDYGFQIFTFDKALYEVLLSNWAVIKKYSPKKPLKSSAFISNSECCRKSTSIAGSLDSDDLIANICKTSEECIAFTYETARESGLQAGFQSSLESIGKLSADDIDLLVLPPLSGATAQELDTIRKLHAKGVNLLGFENVTGLEDLFGVEEDKEVQVHHIQAIEDNWKFYEYLTAVEEYTDHFACKGKYRAKSATILLDAEIPVLLTHTTPTGKTAFFNIPPTLVRRDQLAQRVSYGRQSTSKLINSAMAAILHALSDAAVKTTAGELIAFEAAGGESVIIVENISKDTTITPNVRVRKRKHDDSVQSCDVPHHIISENDSEINLCLKLEPEITTVITIQN